MREIKFRVFDRLINKMIEVKKIEWAPHQINKFEGRTGDSGGWHNVHKGFLNEKGYFNGSKTRIKRYVLMQRTDHEDKNGNEIYEGDIDTDGYGNLSVVVYIQKYAAYCFVPIEFYRHGGYESEGMYQFLYDYFFHNMIPNQYAEIIGNIYENPELLEVE